MRRLRSFGQVAVLIGIVAAARAAQASPQPVDHVMLVAVDGLRSDVWTAWPPDVLPHLHRLRATGAGTLNARTDDEYTVTIPNYLGMITGRLACGDRGHGWANNDPVSGDDLHGAAPGGYVQGMFDVAHDRGVHTAILTGKTKFLFFDESWGPLRGAPDTVGDDHGRDKIDLYLKSDVSEVLTSAALQALRGPDRRTLVLLHYAGPDDVGHEFGWDMMPNSPYMRAVQRVDRELGRLLTALEHDPAIRDRAALILTADHGGGVPRTNHSVAREPVNFTIPFVVRIGAGGEPEDLYDLNRSVRRDPGDRQPHRDAPGLPPIRNGDAANLALRLLGLPPVPGSTLNARQELAVRRIDRDETPPPKPEPTSIVPPGAAYD
jgi:hypothetical protein